MPWMSMKRFAFSAFMRRLIFAKFYIFVLTRKQAFEQNQTWLPDYVLCFASTKKYYLQVSAIFISLCILTAVYCLREQTFSPHVCPFLYFHITVYPCM